MLIAAGAFVALVLGGAWLARWGERRGRSGVLWSLLKVCVALQWLLDALPGDRTQVELPPREDRADRRADRTRRR
ncbi:hypothetical protein [Deinococcus sonorensis]|uniref:Uncharacterized protein n=2 Tax=Deinococcus sonorensis TaxID=309891 RepID=A0AAU7U5A7_9DEIO